MDLDDLVVFRCDRAISIEMRLFRYPAIVRPYFGFRNTRRVMITARVLRMRDPQWQSATALGKVATMLSQFVSHEVPGLSVTLELSHGGRETLAVTQLSDADGYLSFDIELAEEVALPAEPAWEIACLRWTNRLGPQSAEAFILAPGQNNKLAVISDIDDTIVETGATELSRNWRRILAQMPSDREVVPGVVGLYGRLGGGNLGDRMPASRRPFFYVSSSPWNLFDYLVAFQKLHGLPQGPLLLRNWGLDRATLGHASHKGHKGAAIRDLAAFYPDLRFALIGDDTQADALAYADAVVANPGRIAAVFIRQAPGAGLSLDEQRALDAIASAGVPLWTGTSYDVGADFLDKLGFSLGGETTQIVSLIEEAKVKSSIPVIDPAFAR